MSFMYTCWGCGRELDEKNDGVFTQGTKHEPQKYKLCKPCNRKWSIFKKESQAIYDAIDLTRDKKLEEIRLKVFGTKEQASKDEAKQDMPILGNATERIPEAQ